MNGPWAVIVYPLHGQALSDEQVAVDAQVTPGRHHPRDQVPPADAERRDGLGWGPFTYDVWFLDPLPPLSMSHSDN